MSTRPRIAVLLATAAIVLAACGSGGGSPAPAAPSEAPASAGAASEAPASAAAGGEPVTVDWWHITTGDPGKTDFQKAADDYMAANPNVTI
jgi:raffinose/stachyose/melibiose transport system substrate-binding protein